MANLFTQDEKQERGRLAAIEAGLDYDVLRAHFGQTAGSGSEANGKATVPEPATVTLVLLILVAARARLRCRRIS